MFSNSDPNDYLAPALEEMRVELTKRCNAACAYCYLGNSRSNSGAVLCEQTFQLLMAQGQALGLHTVSFSGGEPLLHSSLLIRLIERAKSLGLQAGLLTNGHLLNASSMQQFSDAGLNWIRISADAPPDDTAVASAHARTSGHLSEVIEMTKAKHILILLRATVSKHNAHSLASLARFAEANSVDRLELQPYFPTGDYRVDRRFRMPPALHLETAAEALRLRRAFSGRLNFMLYSGWFEFLSNEYQGEAVRGSRCGRSFLFADSLGLLKTCGPSFRTLGSSDERSSSLARLWRGDDYLKTIRDPQPTGHCARCRWFGICRFWCPATNTVFGLEPNHPIPTCPRIMAAARPRTHATEPNALWRTHDMELSVC